MISVTGLTKVYKTGEVELVVLNNLAFDVEQGEFVAITGRSGSGKSTLLYQLGLLDIPTAGEIKLNDIETWKLNDDERGEFRLRELGFVFQDYALIPSLTAIENVMTPLLMQGFSNQEASEKSLIALDRVGLADKVNNLPNQMSGGQQQRVSIARAIGHSPLILFADEPTANLDSETSLQVMQAFLDLHKQGQTIVMVTHELEYAQETNRIITLADGVIKSDKNAKKK